MGVEQAPHPSPKAMGRKPEGPGAATGRARQEISGLHVRGGVGGRAESAEACRAFQ